MEQVIENIQAFVASVTARIPDGVTRRIPEAGTPDYWVMVGGALAVLALLVVWLVARTRQARMARHADTVFAQEVTFDDISAEAAASRAPETAQQPAAGAAGLGGDAPANDAPAEHSLANNSSGNSAAANTAGSESGPVSGFRFFKKKSKQTPSDDDSSRRAAELEDDVFLLGLEQEMLATRQLYLDGLISKEVYVTETRALYTKAQSRMT